MKCRAQDRFCISNKFPLWAWRVYGRCLLWEPSHPGRVEGCNGRLSPCFQTATCVPHAARNHLWWGCPAHMRSCHLEFLPWLLLSLQSHLHCGRWSLTTGCCYNRISEIGEFIKNVYLSQSLEAGSSSLGSHMLLTYDNVNEWEGKQTLVEGMELRKQSWF